MVWGGFEKSLPKFELWIFHLVNLGNLHGLCMSLSSVKYGLIILPNLIAQFWFCRMQPITMSDKLNFLVHNWHLFKWMKQNKIEKWVLNTVKVYHKFYYSYTIYTWRDYILWSLNFSLGVMFKSLKASFIWGLTMREKRPQINTNTK